MVDWNKIERCGVSFNANEAITASAIKTYLRGLPEEVALCKMQKVMKPRVMQLPMDGEPLKIVNADIDAPAFQVFLQEALDWGVRCLQADMELERGLKVQLIARLRKVSAASIIQNMSVDLLECLAICYGALKESNTWS